jgi:hypothetical protein
MIYAAQQRHGVTTSGNGNGADPESLAEIATKNEVSELRCQVGKKQQFLGLFWNFFKYILNY